MAERCGLATLRSIGCLSNLSDSQRSVTGVGRLTMGIVIVRCGSQVGEPFLQPPNSMVLGCTQRRSASSIVLSRGLIVGRPLQASPNITPVKQGVTHSLTFTEQLETIDRELGFN